jgi:hypothetical protein
LREAVERLAERARTETWTYEEFLTACLQREVAARESHGGEGRIRVAHFPSRKSLEEFDFDHARGLKRDTIAHLGTLDSPPEAVTHPFGGSRSSQVPFAGDPSMSSPGSCVARVRLLSAHRGSRR